MVIDFFFWNNRFQLKTVSIKIKYYVFISLKQIKIDKKKNNWRDQNLGSYVIRVVNWLDF